MFSVRGLDLWLLLANYLVRNKLEQAGATFQSVWWGEIRKWNVSFSEWNSSYRRLSLDTATLLSQLVCDLNSPEIECSHPPLLHTVQISRSPFIDNVLAGCLVNISPATDHLQISPPAPTISSIISPGPLLQLGLVFGFLLNPLLINCIYDLCWE